MAAQLRRPQAFRGGKHPCEGYHVYSAAPRPAFRRGSAAGTTRNTAAAAAAAAAATAAKLQIWPGRFHGGKRPCRVRSAFRGN